MKKLNDKHPEIDAHVTKHYDILRRLGKGVSFVLFIRCIVVLLTTLLTLDYS